MSSLKEAIKLIVSSKQVDDKIVNAVKTRVAGLLHDCKLKVISEPNKPKSIAVDQRTISVAVRDVFSKIVINRLKLLATCGTIPNIKLIYKKLDDNTDGEYNADQHTITISVRLFVQVGIGITRRIREVITNQSELSDSQIVTRTFRSTNIDKTVRVIWSVVAHELIHANQFTRAGRCSYRSYITRDVNSFYAEIAAATQGLPKSYFGSPEEIGACVHQHTLSMIRKLKESKPNEAIKTLNKLIATLTVGHVGYEQFIGSSNKIEQFVIKRYFKKMYLELDQYREHLKSLATRTGK